jgi:hypothetical protein
MRVGAQRSQRWRRRENSRVEEAPRVTWAVRKKSRSKGIEERPLSDLEPFTRLERIREALYGLRTCDMALGTSNVKLNPSTKIKT